MRPLRERGVREDIVSDFEIVTVIVQFDFKSTMFIAAKDEPGLGDGVLPRPHVLIPLSSVIDNGGGETDGDE